MINKNRFFYLVGQLHKRKMIPFGVMRMFSGALFDNKLDTFQNSLKFLNEISPDSNGSSYGKNHLSVKYDLQIIVPAYNCETTITDCLNSILKQKTQYSFIIDVVDDGSTDNTSKILENLRENDLFSRLNIIHQKNEGLSGARNTGLKELKGKYVLFVDADDVLPQHAVERLMDAADKNNADIVEGGYNIFDDKKGIFFTFKHDNRLDNNPFDVLYGYPWGKVYRATLFKNVIFPKGYWYEDTVGMYRLWPRAKHVVTIKSIIYNYRRNTKGITISSKGENKSIDTLWITKKLLSECDPQLLNTDLFVFTLNQIIMNTRRLSYLDDKVNKANFVISRNLIDKYFKRYKTDNKKIMEIKNALENNNYIRFLTDVYKF